MTPLLLQRSKDADFKVHLAPNISLYFMWEALLVPALYSLHLVRFSWHRPRHWQSVSAPMKSCRSSASVMNSPETTLLFTRMLQSIGVYRFQASSRYLKVFSTNTEELNVHLLLASYLSCKGSHDKNEIYCAFVFLSLQLQTSIWTVQTQNIIGL